MIKLLELPKATDQLGITVVIYVPQQFHTNNRVTHYLYTELHDAFSNLTTVFVFGQNLFKVIQ